MLSRASKTVTENLSARHCLAVARPEMLGTLSWYKSAAHRDQIEIRIGSDNRNFYCHVSLRQNASYSKEKEHCEYSII
jgi:hypothetical protein